LLEVNAKFGLRAFDLVLGWYIFLMFRTSVSFNGKLLPNFNLKNMISTYSKIFHWKKMTQICQISIYENSKLPEPYDNFQKVIRNI